MKNLPDFFRSGSMSRTGNTNPYKEMAKLQRQLDQVFTDMWNANPVDLVAPVEQFAEFAPSCEVKETDDHYLMSFDIPGAKKEDIKIEFQDGYLMVSGERKQEFEQKGKNHYTERSYGSFCRTFELPSGVKPDQVEAHYADGVLKVAFPKVETAKPQQIKIGEGKSSLWDKLLGHKKEETKQPPQQVSPHEKLHSEKVA